MVQEVGQEELLERVQQIAPVVREYADQGEQQRHLADPIIEAIREAGLYQMLVPRELGGLQVDPLTFYLTPIMSFQAGIASGEVGGNLNLGLMGLI